LKDNKTEVKVRAKQMVNKYLMPAVEPVARYWPFAPTRSTGDRRWAICSGYPVALRGDPQLPAPSSASPAKPTLKKEKPRQVGAFLYINYWRREPESNRP